MRLCVSSTLRCAWRSHKITTVHCRAFTCSRASLERRSVSELLSHNAAINEVEVTGWIRSLRKQKRVSFLALGDGTTVHTLQAVLTPEQSENLVHGTAVRLHGHWIQSAGKDQAKELKVSSVEICGENDAENNPIQPKYQSSEFLRTVPHLRPRMATNALLLRLRSEAIASITNWFGAQGFVQCHTPIITSSDCEGAGEVFTLLSGEEVVKSAAVAQPFFRTSKYLTVSGQLHLEALAQAVDKVWTLSPTFRAEKSDTPRHLSEFYMLEAELCFTRGADEVMNVVEQMLRALAKDLKTMDIYTQLLAVREKSSEETTTAKIIQTRWNGLTSQNWPRITYKEAIDTLVDAHETGNHIFTIPPSYDNGLAAEHERYLADVYGRGSPVFIIRYPASQKPFYMLPVEGQNTVDCFDLLVPDLCELVGGSLREHRLNKLEATMAAKHVSGEALDWYKDLRRYGSVPHGGFGLGFDRLLCYLAGVSSSTLLSDQASIKAGRMSLWASFTGQPPNITYQPSRSALGSTLPYHFTAQLAIMSSTQPLISADIDGNVGREGNLRRIWERQTYSSSLH